MNESNTEQRQKELESKASSSPDWSDGAIASELFSADDIDATPALLAPCLGRLRALREEATNRWTLPPYDKNHAPLVDWFLAALIARVHPLLVGPPGGAKSEVVVHTLRALGLQQNVGDPKKLRDLKLLEAGGQAVDPGKWADRYEKEALRPKYFHALVSKFTREEELFGIEDIATLRHGYHARVNFASITSPGTYFAFLDETFKASGSLLNSLLMLMASRHYTNFSSVWKADLLSLIGASNELPGEASHGGSLEDFATLHAFLDRFAIRLDVAIPNASEVTPTNSALGKAFTQAIAREGKAIAGRSSDHDHPKASISDLLVVGRALLRGRIGGGSYFINESDFEKAFLETALELQHQGTDLNEDRISWTINPRKLKDLYKVALAHALITKPSNQPFETNSIYLTQEDLGVFRHTWDSLRAKESLEIAVDETLHRGEPAKLPAKP